ncbi:MAG: hypothetical protein F6K41_41750 [Symploca sp. SIO3E6]|nr:hypothetical protein [Caldora sp. SIO3E6]
MANLYTDEHIPLTVVTLLRTFGHDVLTAQEAGNANLRIPDEEVLSFAVSNQRAVLTQNRRHFIKLHNQQPDHTGIIVCTRDLNWERLAARINEAISAEKTLNGKLIRVNRPSE